MLLENPIKREIRRVRLKIQREQLLKGLAIVAVFLLAASILSAVWLSRSNFSDAAILWSRITGMLLLGILVFRYLVSPLVWKHSDRTIARFLEEQYRGMHNRISTAVELLRSPEAVHPQIRKLVERDAAASLRRLEIPAFFRLRASLTAIVSTLASLLLFLALFWAGPEAYRYSLNKLLLAGGADPLPPLYSIEVSPGNTRLVRHADVEIRAVLHGFTSERVQLHAKYENQPAWEATSMKLDTEGSDYVFLFFDVREQIDYFVEADGIRSDSFTVEVSDAPSVQTLEIVLTFPAYTGMEPRTQTDEGDIRALTGTEAQFAVKTDQPVQAGYIGLEEGGQLNLEPVSPTEFRGSLKITRDDFYRIHLQNAEGVWNPSSDEFVVEALIDQPPSISFTRPGRDKKVTNLEEVFTELKAEDDHGVRDARLLFSVNGEAEQAVKLEIPRHSRSLTASHTFYLEEYDLIPGDFVSYYAEARDAVSAAKTDIYFLEVQPYDREYVQSQQAGGAAGGGGEDLMLSRLQKEIITATFNMLRDQRQTSREDFEENVQTVAIMQQQLQQQAQAIAERIQRRGLDVQRPMFKTMLEHLQKAMVHMQEAHSQLTDRKPEAAVPPEQKSYQQLLRAESLFKEIQIAMGGSPGGEGSSSAQELADMVDLELDQKKNQYETLQQNRQQSRDQALDDVARKLKELAQRQEQELERKRRQGQQSSSGSGGSQDQLVEELEELARQLERLSRQERDQQLNEISRSLRQAARDMKRNQSGQSSAEAQMQAQRALDRLQQLQNRLNRQRDTQLSDSVQQLAEESRQLAERQQEVVDRLRELESRQNQDRIDEAFVQELNQLQRDKMELQEDVQKLESGLHQSAKRLSSKQPEASRKLKEAGNSVRDQRIPEKMAEGGELLRRAWTSLARQREEGVAEDLEQLAESVQEARQALGKESTSPQEKTEQALNRLGSLVEDLESLRERAQGGQKEEGSTSGQEQTLDQQGKQSPGQQGDPSESPGQTPGQPQAGDSDSPSQGGEGQRGTPRQEASQQGSEQGMTPSGSRDSEFTRGSFLGQGRISPQQVRREWQERIQDAERIRDLLRGSDPTSARDIANLARQMREMDAQRILEDPEEVAMLKAQIIDGLRDLELRLYRQVREQDDQLQLTHEEEVPPSLREQVEEYYRALASERNR